MGVCSVHIRIFVYLSYDLIMVYVWSVMNE